MTTNYRGLSSRRQHQTVPLSAFVAGGRQASWGETAALSSPPNVHLYTINRLQKDQFNSPEINLWTEKELRELSYNKHRDSLPQPWSMIWGENGSALATLKASLLIQDVVKSTCLSAVLPCCHLRGFPELPSPWDLTDKTDAALEQWKSPSAQSHAHTHTPTQCTCTHKECTDVKTARDKRILPGRG